SYLDSNGIDAALVCPKLSPLLDLRNGCCIGLWMRLEGFNNPVRKDVQRSYLFRVQNQEGHGLEACFERGSLLVLVLHPDPKRAQFVRFQTALPLKRWLHVAFCHTYHYLKKSEVALYVNGEPKERLPLQYPRFERGYVTLALGAAGARDDGMISGASSSSFYGQLGAVAFLNESLADSEIASLYQIGPDCGPPGVGHPGIGFVRSEVLLSQRRSVHVSAMYHPAAFRGVHNIDISQVHMSDALERSCSRVHGMLGVQVRDAALGLQGLGGIYHVVPLLVQVAQAISWTRHRDLQPSLFTAFHHALGVAEAMVHSLPEKLVTRKRDRVWLVLGYLLESVAVALASRGSSEASQWFGVLMGAEFQDTLVRIADALYVLRDHRSFVDFFRFVLFNFRIWGGAPFSVHLEMLKRVGSLMKRTVDLCRR
ncbi:MAG TPA: LamG-like jellyroll fold domain-containing protein, partial [archaeon]|nr:LamG-like jellyroll fold domain-containing protein [archaeon]